jgi:hypothetical protein
MFLDSKGEDKRFWTEYPKCYNFYYNSELAFCNTITYSATLSFEYRILKCQVSENSCIQGNRDMNCACSCPSQARIQRMHAVAGQWCSHIFREGTIMYWLIFCEYQAWILSIASDAWFCGHTSRKFSIKFRWSLYTFFLNICRSLWCPAWQMLGNVGLKLGCHKRFWIPFK